MVDFAQEGMITTIHDLKQRQLEDYENELREFTKYRPVTLVLPSLYSELERPALTKIVQELKEADYIQQIIIGLDQANPEQFKHAKEFFPSYLSRIPFYGTTDRVYRKSISILKN
ncbi:hypothetical protein QJS67_02545 [Acinetobacter radioresistens]|nr:hypothetical protein QJS67_02545 [Acinetobacter radioresistens]